MKNKQTSLESKIKLPVPNNLLQRFDEAIQGTFPSRNEAIRRGMRLVLDELKLLNDPNQKPSSPNSDSKQFSENNNAMQSGKAGRD